MIEIALTIACSVVGSTGLWKLIDGIIARRTKKQTQEGAALLALLHTQLYERGKKAIDRAEISVGEYDDLQHIAEAYFNLGGNGTGKMIFEEVKKLKKTTGTSPADLKIEKYFKKED